jgi:hypothetical protein
MSSKNNNVKNSHLSEDELLNHSLTGNNQIEFKDIVSKCLDDCNNSYGPLPKIIGMVVEQVKRQLTEHEIKLVNEMLKMRKRFISCSTDEEKALVNKLHGETVKKAEKEVEIRMAKKRKLCLDPKPRKSEVKLARKPGPEKYYTESWPLNELYNGKTYSKEEVVANQKKLCTFFHVWSELARYKDEEESKQISDKAWEMCNDMDMEEEDWNNSVTDACKLHVKFRRNGNVGDEDFEKLFEYVCDFNGVSRSNGLNGRELYYAYEYQYLSKAEWKEAEEGLNFNGKRINDCWTDLEEYQSTVDVRMREIRQNWKSEEEKECYAEIIKDLNQEDEDWRKVVDRDSRVIKVLEDHNNKKNNHPLKNGTKMHLQNAVKLISLLRIWSRILGLPTLKPDVSLNMKIYDMEMAMEFTAAHRARAIEIVDEAFENIKDGVEMMNFVEREKIFLRLKSYYQTFMNISDAAVENFIADYEENFSHCRAYESMIGILRQEITQNFCCEDEKKTFADRIKELDEADSEWRDRVIDDWRIKEARGETEDPE